MEDFATYILEEENLSQKMIIAYYLSKKTGIFFDKSVVLKTEIANLFINYMHLNVDKNLVTTAMLLCNCKKIENAQKIGKLETYAKDGAQYLETLGFNSQFCKICEQVNRYSGSEPREKEGDILEIVDQFTGLILNRIERDAFNPEEALVVLQERNLKYVENRYKREFVTFIQDFEKITIKEGVDVSIIKKLVHLHNKEANVKTLIASLANRYIDRIDVAVLKFEKSLNRKVIKQEYEEKVVSHMERMRQMAKESKSSNRALFSQDTAKKILNHKSDFKIS